MKLWANMVRGLDVETIAPQHGALFRGRDKVEKFIEWVESLECGVDLLGEKDYIYHNEAPLVSSYFPVPDGGV